MENICGILSVNIDYAGICKSYLYMWHMWCDIKSRGCEDLCQECMYIYEHQSTRNKINIMIIFLFIFIYYDI